MKRAGPNGVRVRNVRADGRACAGQRADVARRATSPSGTHDSCTVTVASSSRTSTAPTARTSIVAASPKRRSCAKVIASTSVTSCCASSCRAAQVDAAAQRARRPELASSPEEVSTTGPARGPTQRRGQYRPATDEEEEPDARPGPAQHARAAATTAVQRRRSDPPRRPGSFPVQRNHRHASRRPHHAGRSPSYERNALARVLARRARRVAERLERDAFEPPLPAGFGERVEPILRGAIGKVSSAEKRRLSIVPERLLELARDQLSSWGRSETCWPTLPSPKSASCASIRSWPRAAGEPSRSSRGSARSGPWVGDRSAALRRAPGRHALRVPRWNGARGFGGCRRERQGRLRVDPQERAARP